MAVSRLGVVNYIQMYMRVARGWPWSLTDPGLHLVVVHFVQRHAAEHGMCAVVE